MSRYCSTSNQTRTVNCCQQFNGTASFANPIVECQLAQQTEAAFQNCASRWVGATLENDTTAVVTCQDKPTTYTNLDNGTPRSAKMQWLTLFVSLAVVFGAMCLVTTDVPLVGSGI